MYNSHITYTAIYKTVIEKNWLIEKCAGNSRSCVLCVYFSLLFL